MRKVLENKWFLPIIITLVSFTYYYLLHSRIFTWIYVSGDAGDWLQQMYWWTVPHVMGKPLYIWLIRALSYLPFNDIELATIGLSVIPGAITVAITYLIGLELTKSKKLAILSSLIVLASGTFLSQATIIEQYAFTAMLFTIAYLFYLKDKWVLAVIFLGLGTATHVFVAVVAIMWLVMEYKQWKRIVKLIPLFIIFGILPYGFIIYLMTTSAPNLIAGNLSWAALGVYCFGNTTSSLSMALMAFPQRLQQATGILLLTFGLAWYPLFQGLRKPWNTHKKTALIVIGFALWFYLTNRFPSTWKYVAMTVPLMAGFAVYGLSQLKPWHTKLILSSVIILIVLNSIFLNSDKLAREKPLATEFYDALWELEDGSAIATPRGGAYGFALFYVLSQGKDLVPIALSGAFDTVDVSYEDYKEWLKSNYDVKGDNCLDMVDYKLKQGTDVYFISPITNFWSIFYETEETGTFGLYRVTDVETDIALSEMRK